jgi:hypothetical protein
MCQSHGAPLENRNAKRQRAQLIEAPQLLA